MTLRAMLTPARLRSAALPTACWAWTRAVLMMFVYNVIPYISHGDITGDVKLYNRWSQVFGQGRFPQHDPTWQYPPGAGIVIAVQRLIRSFTGMSYYSAFFLLALSSDFIVFLLVVYRCWRTAEQTGHERADYLGAYVYVAAIFMLGPIVFGRYDIAVTMIASVGLAVALRTTVSTWRVRGVAIGLGTIVKIWPIALVFGLPRGPNGRRAMAWSLLSAVVPTVLLLVLFPGALSFLTQQHSRGLEVESVLATPFLLARHLGYHGVIKNRYGSFEITGPGIGWISSFCELLTLVGFCWLLWWRRRARLTPERWSEGVYYDAALVAVLISIITSRVLSPQYLVWICGLIALCLALTPLRRAQRHVSCGGRGRGWRGGGGASSGWRRRSRRGAGDPRRRRRPGRRSGACRTAAGSSSRRCTRTRDRGRTRGRSRTRSSRTRRAGDDSASPRTRTRRRAGSPRR